MKRNDALFFTCSLVECIGREVRQPRSEVIHFLGDDLRRIYTHADVFHCEEIRKVAYDFIQKDHIPTGNYDTGANVKYTIPDCWDIGEVFERLIEDCFKEGDELRGLREVFSSWICTAILNFNSDLYYQPRDYSAACFTEGHIIAA